MPKKKTQLPPPPPPVCSCPQWEEECPACMGKLREVAHLLQKAFIEFIAKCEWIGTSQKVDCVACVISHADRMGAMIIKEVFPLLDYPLREKLLQKMTGFLIARGVTSLERIHEAYRALTAPGTIKTMDELFRALYGGAPVVP